MRKGMALVLCGLFLLMLAGCTVFQNTEPVIYEASYLDLFDTLTVIKGTGESREAFTETVEALYGELAHYHRLFDIYNAYEGVNNLKTVNDMAGIGPVEVDGAIIDLLTDCRSYYDLTGGRVNVAMGSVLQLWHEARNAGLEDPAHAKLPDMADLNAAAAHTAIDSIVIDRDSSTVFITDPAVQLDVGAVAKGWSGQRIAEKAPEGFLISIGGNVCATGPKTASGTPWVIGVQDPAGEGYLHTLNVTGGSFVTSGDYQRCYTVDGRSYHHIIDPDTRMPSEYWRSVTVICSDSGLADALSTALFLLPQPEGQALLVSCGAEAMWVDAEGGIRYSPGFEAYVRS